MKEIVFNEDNLQQENINLRKEKARAIIIDDKRNITITNYCDMYMLPGGKIEKNETAEEGLIRELKEELGITFQKEELIPFIKTNIIAKDYPVRNSSKTNNRSCITHYFIIKSNQKVNFSKTNLTQSEKEKNFNVSYVPLERLIEVLENHISYNIRDKYFKKELLIVIKEFIKCNYYEKIVIPSEEVIDLHVHTTASDGELSPTEIINEALKKEITILSITDHDTIDGYKKLEYDHNKITIIPGIELSAKSKTGRMHILGYNININDVNLNNKLKELRENSINNFLNMLMILEKDYGITFSTNEIKKILNSTHNLGRPDLAKLLIKYQLAETFDDAFTKYLIDVNEKVRNKSAKPSAIECLNIISQANGIPILAHPNTLLLDDDELYSLIINLKEHGLMGLEVYHSNLSKIESKKYIEIAIRENLFITGGSDYHGPIAKKEIKLKTGKNNNVKIKSLNILNYIKTK